MPIHSSFMITIVFINQALLETVTYDSSFKIVIFYIINISFHKTFSTLIKVTSPKSAFTSLHFNYTTWSLRPSREYYRGEYHCNIDLLFNWFGISCMTTENFCFYLQNRLIQTSQTGGQWYSDTSSFSIPWPKPFSLVF